MSKELMTQDFLKTHLSYDPLTGEFIWVKRSGCRVPAGVVAGTITQTGYVSIGICGMLWKAHRLAFLYMTGAFPLHGVDHIDGIKTNNVWSNLRIATRSQNAHNNAGRGYYWDKRRKKWSAYIHVDSKTIYLGMFQSESDARRAHLKACKVYHAPGYVSRKAV